VDPGRRGQGPARAQWSADIQIGLAGADAAIQLAFWQGDHAGAVAEARKSIVWLESMQPWLLGGIRIGALGITAAAAQATAARAHGDLEKAVEAVSAGEELIAHVRQCAELGQPRSSTLGLEGLAWLARAEASASGLAGPADPALWEKVVEAFGYGAVYEQAICRWHFAEALLAAGDAARAAEELVQAHETADRLGAHPLRDAVREVAHRARIALPGQAVVPVRDVVSPLTDREQVVLERVALGRTNRQVGEELYISEKTVSVHLSRVMAKLGANRRAEAVAIAYDRGLLVKPSAAG
jgi:DNA-binding CsgD family transcriptional regulator